MVAASPAPSILEVAQLSLNITIYGTRYKAGHTSVHRPSYLVAAHRNAPLASRWVPDSARIAVVGATAGGKGCLQVLQLEGSALTSVADVRKPSPLKCGTFGAAGEVLPHVLPGSEPSICADDAEGS